MPMTKDGDAIVGEKRRVTRDQEVGQDHMILKADPTVNRFRLAKNHGGAMTQPARRVNQSTLTSNH